MTKKITTNPVFQCIVLAFAAVFSAFNYEVFIFPNNFAPAGLNGLATIVQYLSGFNIGYMTLIINLPLLAVAYFTVSRSYSLKTLVYVLAFSAANLVFRSIDLKWAVFHATDGGDAIMAAVAGGVINGFIYSVSLRLGACTGGTDIVAAFVNKVRPEYDLVWVIFTFNSIVAGVSFFVYGRSFRPVILCIIYIFVTSWMNSSILRTSRSAAKFEVITKHPEELAAAIMAELRHGCTVVPATGMYSHSDMSILICVVNRHQLADFEKVLARFDNTFTISHPVSRIYGNFKHIK